MKFSQITTAQLVIIFTLLALLLVYLAINTAFWSLTKECGSICSGLMAGPFVKMFSH